MKKHFYLCGDKKAYNFALKNYADEDTEIAFCKMNDDTDSACRLMFENIDKEFYIFGHCRSGYFKVELKTYMSLEPNTFKGFIIPHKAKKSPKTGKPIEEYIKGDIVEDVVIATNQGDIE